MARKRTEASDEPWHFHREPVAGVGFKFAYSVTELPLLELIQPTSEALSSVNVHLSEHGEGVFHLGYFADDVPDLLQLAEEIGVPVEATSPGGRGIAYLDPAGAHGVRVELVPSTLREPLLHWVRSGEWTL